MSDSAAWRFNFSGWLLFTLSAVLFTIGTWQAGDPIGLAASLAFLIACIAFMIPAWINRPAAKPGED